MPLSTVGFVLIAFASQHALAAMFNISSGSCTLSGDCINPGWYGDCAFTTLAVGTVSTTAFNTHPTQYSSYGDLITYGDRLQLGGNYYSGTTGPSNVYLSSGSQIVWDVGSGQSGSGWELCLVEYNASSTRLFTGGGAGTCTLSTSGDCVSSPNYPSKYDSTDCTIINNQAGYLTATTFNTIQAGYLTADSLNIRRRGGTYPSSDTCTNDRCALTATSPGNVGVPIPSTIQNVYLEAGKHINWTVEFGSWREYGLGWQLCNSETAVPTPPPTTAPVGSSASCCTSGVANDPGCMYTGTCGALSTATDCWLPGYPPSQANALLGLPTSGEYCYADSEDDCCESDGGAVAGIVIAILVFCGIIVACCCFFCGSCPLAKNRNQKTVVHVQEIQPTSVSKPMAPAPVVHQPVQPPPQAIPIGAQPFAMVAQPIMKQEAPPVAPPPQPGVTSAPPYQPPRAPSALTTFCGSCGAPNNSDGAFCASCGAQF